MDHHSPQFQHMAPWYTVINFRICGKNVSSNHFCIFFVKKKSKHCQIRLWFAVIPVKSNLEVRIKDVNTYTTDSATRLWEESILRNQVAAF